MLMVTIKVSRKTIITGAIIIILIIAVGILSLRVWNEQPTETTTTTTLIEQVRDSIIKANIKIPNVVYIDTSKPKIVKVPGKDVIKWKDSLIYIDTAGVYNRVIAAREYPATLEAENASANLSILTTGQLLNVTGIINYKKEINTVETIKSINNSGLFLYGETSVIPKFQQYKVGLDYTIKNSVIVGTSIGYDTQLNAGIVNVKFGIRIF